VIVLTDSSPVSRSITLQDQQITPRFSVPTFQRVSRPDLPDEASRHYSTLTDR
jgi:hypothetical protein